MAAAITASNIWGLRPIRRDSAGQTGYYLYDGHSDVVGMVDPAGSVLATYGYDEFGQVVKSTGTFDNPFRYTAEPYDTETGAVYLRSRYYRPDLGRFLTQDTWKGSPWQPWTQNLYTYVGNNPVNYTDPTGHCSPAVLDCILELGPEAEATAEELAALLGLAGAALGSFWDAPAPISGACMGVALTGQCYYGNLTAQHIVDQSKVYSKASSDDGHWDQYDDFGDGGGSRSQGPKKPSNKSQNKEFRDAVNEIRRQLGRPLSDEEQKRLHKEIGTLAKQQGGELLSYGRC